MQIITTCSWAAAAPDYSRNAMESRKPTCSLGVPPIFPFRFCRRNKNSRRCVYGLFAPRGFYRWNFERARIEERKCFFCAAVAANRNVKSVLNSAIVVLYFWILPTDPKIDLWELRLINFFGKLRLLVLCDRILIHLFNEHILLMMTLYFLEMYEIWFYYIFYIRAYAIKFFGVVINILLYADFIFHQSVFQLIFSYYIHRHICFFIQKFVIK